MTQAAKYQGPLAGLNVIDFGHYFAGPMVGMLLADQGANVIRIVRPGEKELPERQYRLLNRNKKLLTLDLKTEERKKQGAFLNRACRCRHRKLPTRRDATIGLGLYPCQRKEPRSGLSLTTRFCLHRQGACSYSGMGGRDRCCRLCVYPCPSNAAGTEFSSSL